MYLAVWLMMCQCWCLAVVNCSSSAQDSIELHDIRHYAYLRSRLVDCLDRQARLIGRFLALASRNISRDESCSGHGRKFPRATEVDSEMHRDTAVRVDNDMPLIGETQYQKSRDSLNFKTASVTTPVLSQLLRNLLEINAEAKTRLGQALRIVLIGQVSHGKSLLVNALLKQQVLPSAAGPVSHMSVIVSGTDEEKPYATADGEGDRRLTLEQLASVVDSQGQGCGNLLSCESVNHTVRLHWPRSQCPVLAHDIEVWDTAGFDYSQPINDAIFHHCLLGDVILAVVDAHMGMSLSLTSVLARLGHANIIVAYSKWDQFSKQVTDSRLEAVRSAYYKRATQLLNSESRTVDHGNSEQDRVFFIDSLTYLQDFSRTKHDRHDHDKGNITPHSDSIKAKKQSLSTEGSRGFADLEASLYKLAAANGMATKLTSSWNGLKQTTARFQSLVGVHCESECQEVDTCEAMHRNKSLELQQLPTMHQKLAQHLDKYLTLMLSTKLSKLSLILGDASEMERNMLEGVDKEVAAHRYVQHLNQRLQGSNLLPDRLQHEIHVQHGNLLETIPTVMKPSVDVLVRQADEKFQLTLGDCALADFQTSSAILMLYAGLRAVVALLLAYILVILQPLRRLGMILTALALLYGVLVVLNFDADMERTRQLVWHIGHSLQHVTHRRLAAASEQHRLLIHQEVTEQFDKLHEHLTRDCDDLNVFCTCQVETCRQCHFMHSQVSILTDHMESLLSFF